MSMHLYPKLAFEGIRKNKRLYIPYILTGSIMIMIYYILCYLVESPAVSMMRGGSNVKMLLPVAAWVIAFFSLIFLFYTNAFLIRQRNREFGLYNILGMNKRNISRMMIWENLMVALLAIVFGLVLGIALSKAAEAGLSNLLHSEVSYRMSIGVYSLGKTVVVYGVIYLFLLVHSLIRVCRLKPLELLSSNKVGEKAPKGNWLLALVGLICLGIAYYLAVTMDDPLGVVMIFFLAVLLVIAATYLLFVAGSVVFCRLLQKNKKYYYKPNHFVSVSTMVYRMKRNGAGLASICILLTMVLVMLSTTVSLYIGAEDSIRTRYPHSINVTVNMSDFNDEAVAAIEEEVIKAAGETKEVYQYCSGNITGTFTDTGLTTGEAMLGESDWENVGNNGMMQVISLKDYNRMMDVDETLEEDECFLCCFRLDYKSDTFTINDGKPYHVKKVLDKMFEDGNVNAQITPFAYVIVKDLNEYMNQVPMTEVNGYALSSLGWNCFIDMDAPADVQIAATDAIHGTLGALCGQENLNIRYYSVQSYEAGREDFYGAYGCMLFLGIMMSIVFLIAAVLIIYYKQMSEGYEDQSRFEIMQKVGMTKKDIHRSINSQILTVFFLPLVFAGIHLAFAFPILWKMLQLFGLTNMPLLIVVTLVCFLLFGLFYAIVYKLTAGVYYGIVSGPKK